MSIENSNEGFVRSRINKGALVNADHDNYVAYKKHRQHLTEINGNISKINSLENELSNIKEDMTEIKQLLLKVLNK
jgi:DNA-binding transcriptional regulator YhcF (GntR family)